MSENKYTPEPWTYYDDRKSTGRIEIVGFGKTVSRIYLSVPDEDVANARRIVACVNACAGIDTEFLEVAPIGIFASKYGSPGYIDQLEKQRDELLAALEGMEKWASSIYDGYPSSTASIAAAPYREAARAAIAKATGEEK